MNLFSHQTKGTIVQILNTIGYEDAKVFIYKHLGIEADPRLFLNYVKVATDEALSRMVAELLTNNKLLRASAPVKHIFDSGIVEIERWVLHDGWIVQNGALVRVTPAAEEVTGIRDKLLQDLESSGLDWDGAIRSAVENSSRDFVAEPPNYNGSVTNIRIALETVARRAAREIAYRRRLSYPKDSWGKALELLRQQSVIEPEEEEVLARMYTFLSPGAHIPKGITAEEWARLARTFGLSSAYFLLRKHQAS